MAIVVTEEEFLHWRDSRVTRAFMYALKQDREWLKEMLLAGTEDETFLMGFDGDTCVICEKFVYTGGVAVEYYRFNSSGFVDVVTKAFVF